MEYCTQCGFISIHFSMGQSKRRLQLDYSPLPPPCRERNRNIAKVIVNILPKMTCCLLPSFLSRCTKDMFTHQIKICVFPRQKSKAEPLFATCVQQIHVRVSPCHSIWLVLVVFIKNMWHPCRNFSLQVNRTLKTPFTCMGANRMLAWNHLEKCVNIPQVLWSQQHQPRFVQTLSLQCEGRVAAFFFVLFYWRCVLMTFQWTAYLIVLVVYPRK